MSLPRLVLACALAGASAVNHTLKYLPFSWDTLPRYTFCVNSSGPLNDEALAYVAKQPIFLNNPVLTRPAGSIDRSEVRMPVQAAALRALNPDQRQWFYYAIDLVRVHNFENDHDQINNMLVDLAITRPVAASVRSFLFQTEEMERRIGYSDLIEFLSPELQGVLCEEISAKRLTAIKYFQHRSSNFRLALFKRMTRRLFCPQELIYEDRLLIIANQGVIGSDGRIYTSGMALNLDFFLVGELRLVLMMRALNYVEVERLAKEDLFEILRDFPDQRMPVMWARVFSALIRKVKQMKVQHKRPSRLARGPSTTSLLFNTGDLVECYQAVSSDPHKLKDVSDAMKDTQPLCEIAVGEDAAAFQYASPRLRADAHFVDYAVLHAGPDAWKTAVLPHVEEPLKTLLTRISASAKVFYENDPGAAGSLCAC